MLSTSKQITNIMFDCRLKLNIVNFNFYKLQSISYFLNLSNLDRVVFSLSDDDDCNSFFSRASCKAPCKTAHWKGSSQTWECRSCIQSPMGSPRFGTSGGLNVPVKTRQFQFSSICQNILVQTLFIPIIKLNVGFNDQRINS